MIPYDRPSALEIVEVVRDFLSQEILGSVERQFVFKTRVAINALDIVSRELRSGVEHSGTHAQRLELFGCENDQVLADRIRNGQLDSNYPELAMALRSLVWDKINVMNPKYANPYTSADVREKR